MSDLNYAVTAAELDIPLSILTSPAPDDVREWMTYDRPAEFESVWTEIQVPTRDGTLLSGRLFRPGRDGRPAEGQFPGIVSDFTPYPVELNEVRHEYLAERGYNVLVCNVRGSGKSEGEFSSWFQAIEAEDNYDAIEWLAAQPFSTDHIGQVGESYGSMTAYRVAALEPPHLRAIAPIASPTNIYEWVYPGGVPTSNGAWWSGQAPILDNAARTCMLESIQSHPLYDEYWKQVVTTNKVASTKIPTLNIGGYYDIFKEGGFDALHQQPQQTWLIYGPWIHAIPWSVPGKFPEMQISALQSVLSTGVNLDEFGPAKTMTYSIFLHWFDHWLDQRPETTPPPAHVISYEDTSTLAAGRWVVFDQWPAPDVLVQRLFPVADGGLSTDAAPPADTEYTVDPFDGPSVSLIGSSPTDVTKNQQYREELNHNSMGRCYGGRTTFTARPFDTDTTVTGLVTFHLSASITAEDTYFVSKLEALLPDGRVLPIEIGSLRARLRTNREELETIPRGKPTDYEISLGHIHWRFRTGEQLRVTISGGDFPRVLPTAPAGLVTIHHGEHTYLELPLASS
ncbi:CocE/NonD family hydrolase [Nocardia salmonicida]|uniref:CocE/NonD family hydrolase n=1 Tax=Nocardia salmonicida TaxID=53431 RepID=UPI0033C869D9